MKVNIYFKIASLLLLGCNAEPVEPDVRPQAVRTVEVRVGPVVEGRAHLAEVVPASTVVVLAQVPGTVSERSVTEGAPVAEGDVLLRVAAPDIAARIARARAERARAERERDFACAQLDTDRLLAGTGDIASVQLDISEKGCASAALAVEATRAAEREATVAGTRAVERAPYDGEVLVAMVDQGQTVMPGKPLLQYGSRQRQLRLRVPQSDLAGVALDTRVQSELGTGHVVQIGAQAMGPGRLVEVLVALEGEPAAAPPRVGSVLTATVVLDERAVASAVPRSSLAEDEQGAFVFVVEDQQLRRVNVALGPQQDGWVAVEPALAAGSLVVSGDLTGLELDRPVLAVLR